jgi:hypothetical protein
MCAERTKTKKEILTLQQKKTGLRDHLPKLDRQRFESQSKGGLFERGMRGGFSVNLLTDDMTDVIHLATLEVMERAGLFDDFTHSWADFMIRLRSGLLRGSSPYETFQKPPKR